MNKLLTSHELVPTVVIMRLEAGKTTIPGWYGVGCRVVPHSCENKAISAPSWGLAGWLGLSLAKISFFQGSHGDTTYKGCLVNKCRNGHWKTTLNNRLCCFNQKVLLLRFINCISLKLFLGIQEKLCD